MGGAAHRASTSARASARTPLERIHASVIPAPPHRYSCPSPPSFLRPIPSFLRPSPSFLRRQEPTTPTHTTNTRQTKLPQENSSLPPFRGEVRWGVGGCERSPAPEWPPALLSNVSTLPSSLPPPPPRHSYALIPSFLRRQEPGRPPSFLPPALRRSAAGRLRWCEQPSRALGSCLRRNDGGGGGGRNDGMREQEWRDKGVGARGGAIGVLEGGWRWLGASHPLPNLPPKRGEG